MSTVTIYRLEHKETGLGPYMHKEIDGEQCGIVLLLNIHTVPIEDSTYRKWVKEERLDGFDLGKEWLFGWTDKKLAKSFLHPDSDISKFNFHWVKYTSLIYFILKDGQVVFNKTASDRKRINLNLKDK